jgi:polygalacturonase
MLNVADFGAVPDGSTLSTAAFAAAIDRAAQHGGGTVLVPPGRYLTGSIILKSNTHLRLEPGATILGSQNPADYPLADGRWEGLDARTHLGLIAAVDAQNVSVTGRGAIDGQGQPWWRMVRQRSLQHPRPRLLCFLRCRDLRVEGLTLLNSPAWTVHPYACQNVTIDGLTLRNPPDSPNTDGINPESCANVHVVNCHIDVGDDCITLKAGADPSHASAPCRNITIANCTLVHGHGGVVIGSEMSGGVRNVVISNCVFEGTDRGIRIKTRRGRGGIVEDVRVSNLIMDSVGCPLVMHMFYRCGIAPQDVAHASDARPQAVGPLTPTIRNIHLAHVTARNVTGPAAGFLYGLPEMPIDGVTLDDVRVALADQVAPEHREPAMMLFDCPSTRGEFYARFTRGLRLRDVRIAGRDSPGVRVEDSSPSAD